MLAVQLSDERNPSSPVCIFISLIAPVHNFIQDIFMHLRNVLFHSLVLSQTTHLFVSSILCSSMARRPTASAERTRPIPLHFKCSCTSQVHVCPVHLMRTHTFTPSVNLFSQYYYLPDALTSPKAGALWLCPATNRMRPIEMVSYHVPKTTVEL